MQEMYISKLSEYLNAIERLKTYYPNQIIVNNPNVTGQFLYELD